MESLVDSYMVAVYVLSPFAPACRPGLTRPDLIRPDSSMRPNMKYSNNLDSKTAFTMNRKSSTDLVVLVLGSMLKRVSGQDGEKFSCVNTSVITCSNALKKLSGQCFKSFATSFKAFSQPCHCPRPFGQRRHRRSSGAYHFSKIKGTGLICNFMARRPKHDPQHFPQ